MGLGDEGEIAKQGKLPSVEDPRLFQVRCKKNFERIACMSLLNKSIDFAARGKPLSILSATCSDSTEGYIYVEAFKEIHVKQACQGLHCILNKFIMLGTEEMPVVYQNDKAKNNELRPNQWVRIKHSGAYNGDIGLVERIDDQKVWIRLIPRIDLTQQGKSDKGKYHKFSKIPQRINFHPTTQMGAYKMTHKHQILEKYITMYKNQLFYKGFLFKPFQFKQLDTSPNIKASHEEIQNF